MQANQKELYKAYLIDFSNQSLKSARFNAVFVVVFFAFFALFENYFIEPLSHEGFNIKAGFFILLSVLLLSTYSIFFKQHWQKILSAFVVFLSIGILTGSFYLKAPWTLLYLQGLLLAIFYTYSLSKLFLTPAVVAGISITVIYILFAINMTDYNRLEIVFNFILLLIANVLGIINILSKQKILYAGFLLKQNDMLRLQEINKLNKELTKLNKDINTLNSIDHLTGVANRKFFDKNISKFVQNSHNEQTPLSLLVIGIDYFIHYNEYYGTTKGDQCLKILAKLINETLVGSNRIVARYGGSEFAIILPNSNYQTAIKLTTQIQNNLKKLRIQHEESNSSPFVTACYGLVTVSDNFLTISEKKIINYADTCLNKAQKSGPDNISAITI